MKRTLLLSAMCVVVVALGGTLWWNAGKVNSPKLDVQDVVRLGEVRRGEKATATIRLKNSGSLPLKIVKYGTQCGCTILAVPKQSLSPGEYEYLTISLDTSGYWREVTKNAYIYCNDLSQPFKIIRIEAYVRMGIRLIGGDLDLGSAPAGAELHGKVEVVKDLDLSHEVCRVEGATSEITVRTGSWNSAEDSEEEEVLISIDTAQLHSGFYSRQLTILLGSETVGKVQLTYSILPRVQCDLKSVAIRGAGAHDAISQDVKLAWVGTAPVFTNVGSLYGHCNCEIVARGRQSCTLRIARNPQFRNSEPAFDVVTVSYHVVSLDAFERMTIPVTLGPFQ